MRKFMLFVCCLFVFGLTQAQEVKPVYEYTEDDLVRVTYFYKDGNVKQRGFFNGKKLTGKWVSFDKNGNKTAIARYKNGKKVGRWLMLSENGLKEIIYKNNKVVSIKTSYGDTELAVK